MPVANQSIVDERPPALPGDVTPPGNDHDVLNDFVLGDDSPAAAAPAATPAAPAAPAAAPVAPAAPAVPAASILPTDTAGFMTALDRQIQESIRRGTAASTPVPVPAPAPAAPAVQTIADPFAGQDLEITAEDEALIGDVRVRRMLEKMTSRALRDYHSRTVAPALQEEMDYRRQAQAREAAMQEQFRRNGLSSAVPDINDLMRDPAYAPFAEEMISLPNIPQPVRRMDALGMAMQSGNFGWINDQFDTLRRQRQAAAAAAGVANANGGASVVAPSASGGSPGQTMPPPGMEALSPRTYSRTKLERELQKLAKEVQLNPRDHASLEKYNRLRAAYGRAAANGTLR